MANVRHMTIVKRVLLTALLTALGFCAGTAPYILVVLASVVAAHSLYAVYPATICSLVIAAAGAATVCLYAWLRRPRSLWMVLPFTAGILIFHITALVRL